ncbi:hypothetical protein Q8A67_008061 [Cirrhinus molitorella]|uniref:Uncharacterized protein n=1 Tax=Cirrhinus molitorella TaxID=172907 RepID=A0AA88Q0Y2_9TELE|nr:hypothetical protein Q8A67_008061 [Cirrhinus molitorella]
MDRKTKREQKKRKKWGKFVASSPDVVASAAAPAEGVQAPSSSSRKCKFPSLRRVFHRILSFLSCVSSCEVVESTETQSTSVDTHADASSSPAVCASSDPEVDLQDETQEKEAIKAGEQSSTFSIEDTSTSTDSRASDLLNETLEMEVIGGCTSTSADDSSTCPEGKPSDLETSGGFTSTSTVGVSSSEESEKIDLLAELQAAALLEDAAGDQTISDADLDCILSVLASMKVQSNGLSQAEILQLIQGSPQQQNQIKIEHSSGSVMEDDVELADVVPTSSPTKIKHLGFPNLGNTCYMNSVLQCLLTISPFRDDVLSQRLLWNDGSTMLRALTDLHMTRLTGNDKNLKVKLLSTVKRCIETRHPDFLGDHQQDAHEFLMVCLAHLKEEGELLQRYWPKYTCPVTNMEFQLNRRRTCDSCGFQRSFREDSSYLSLVISPQGCLVDSLQLYFKTSSFECSCSECAGTMASEALELISLPRVLVLLVMRFDITSSMCKLKNRLDVPEEFALSCSAAESREMRVTTSKGSKQQEERREKDREEASDGSSSTQYRLAGVVSHLGSSLYCGHYVSHIRDFTGSGWLECSDTSIRRSSWEKSSSNIGKNGYMLFYVKRSCSVMFTILVFLVLVYGLEAADVVLSCSLIEEGGGMGGMMGGAMFKRTPSTLVFKDLVGNDGLSPELVTPYNPPETPNADDLIFEMTLPSIEIPNADLLLHADCNEKEVVCEISRYVPRGAEMDSLPAHFIGSVQLEGGGISLTLVLQTLHSETAQSDTEPLMQSKLNLPLSQSGTLLTEVVFVVFSRVPSVVAPIGGDALLDCGFRQKNSIPGQDVALEWRIQHRGNGRKILDMTARETETDIGQDLFLDRNDTSAEADLLVRDGNASLTLRRLKVTDEGTYICTVGSGEFQTQQIVQLHITQPPRITLSEEKLIFQDATPKKLSCHCHRYYPLDVQVEWFSQAPSEEEPVSLSKDSSLSSHRQHSDGTYSLSSHLTLRPDKNPPGTVITCRVSHPSLETHSDATLTVDEPEPEIAFWTVVLMVAISVVFLYQAFRGAEN